jgi:RNA polymerase-interacting CarD/CdnL/TRCF family regulator
LDFERGKMLFKVNDVVVHEVYGVGRIMGIEELSWKKPECSSYYVMMIGDTKLWVPVESKDGCHLRFITPKKDLLAYRKIFSETPSKIDTTGFGRTNFIQENRKHSTFRVLCETVKDLTAQNLSKKLSNHETAFLESVTRQLIEEWALSAQISMEQAEGEINKLLQNIPRLPALPIE